MFWALMPNNEQSLTQAPKKDGNMKIYMSNFSLEVTEEELRRRRFLCDIEVASVAEDSEDIRLVSWRRYIPVYR